jgi:hypothetical protein
MTEKVFGLDTWQVDPPTFGDVEPFDEVESAVAT